MATAAVNPTAAANTINSGIGSLANNYETFLKLLTTQLKNQDPLSPLETNEFTQQLTQMTGVQQQLLTNQLLTQMISQGQMSDTGQAVGLIGKQVTVKDPTVTLTGGVAQFGYSLGSGAAETVLEILNSSGQVVWSGKAADNAAGPHTFEWNGRSSLGKQLPDGGAYALRVSAKTAGDQVVPTATTATGVVTRIENIEGQTVLTLGAAKALMNSITSVSAPPT